MAKKSAPKANKPRIGQQTKTSAKGAHGGGVKFSQISLGPGFENVTGKGANAGKTAAKLPKAKKNIAEANAPRPKVMLGKGFIASNVTEAVKGPAGKGAKGAKARPVDSKIKAKGRPAVKPKKGKGR